MEIFDIIKESFFEVIEKSVNLKLENSIIPLKRGYAVSIDMIDDKNKDLKISTYIVFNKVFLKIMCEKFLCEEDPDEDAITDMAKELANLIIGHAKVIAQNYKTTFNISTPTYLGIKVVANYEEGLHFRLLGEGHCSLFLHKLKA